MYSGQARSEGDTTNENALFSNYTFCGENLLGVQGVFSSYENSGVWLVLTTFWHLDLGFFDYWEGLFCSKGGKIYESPF